MSRQESLFDFLDRLDPVPASSAQSERPSRISHGPAELDLTKLSDAELTELLATLTSELQRRLAQGRGHRAELAAGIREAVQLLESLRPRAPKQEKRPRSRGEVPALQEGQRKAVRAALLAGVAPGQVARHFGLPLAAVREVLEHAASVRRRSVCCSESFGTLRAIGHSYPEWKPQSRNARQASRAFVISETLPQVDHMSFYPDDSLITYVMFFDDPSAVV